MKVSSLKAAAALAVLAAMTAATAHADTAAPAPIKIVWQAQAKMNLADPRLSLATPYAQRNTETPLPSGTVKTAIDRRFASDTMTGSVGYLCGLQPGPNESGGVASAFDPAGTFLGGKLTLAFK